MRKRMRLVTVTMTVMLTVAGCGNRNVGMTGQTDTQSEICSVEETTMKQTETEQKSSETEKQSSETEQPTIEEAEQNILQALFAGGEQTYAVYYNQTLTFYRENADETPASLEGQYQDIELKQLEYSNGYFIALTTEGEVYVYSNGALIQSQDEIEVTMSGVFTLGETANRLYGKNHIRSIAIDNRIGENCIVVGSSREESEILLYSYLDESAVSEFDSSKTEYTDFAIAGNYIIGLNGDGNPRVMGDVSLTDALIKVNQWEEIESIVADYDTVIGLKEDGTVTYTDGVSTDLDSWNHIVSLSASDRYVTAVTEDGHVKAISWNGTHELDLSDVENAVYAKAMDDRIFVITEDGEVIWHTIL